MTKKVGDKIVTIAEQFKAEGIHLVAVNLLEKGSDVMFVAEVTKLSLDEVKRLKNQIKH